MHIDTHTPIKQSVVFTLTTKLSTLLTTALYVYNNISLFLCSLLHKFSIFESFDTRCTHEQKYGLSVQGNVEIHSEQTHICKNHDTEYDTGTPFVKQTTSKTDTPIWIHSEVFK